MEVELKIKDKQGDKLILEDNNHNLIYWPSNKFPNNLAVGDVVKFYIGQVNPKAILNELLNVSTDNKK